MKQKQIESFMSFVTAPVRVLLLIGQTSKHTLAHINRDQKLVDNIEQQAATLAK